MLSLLVSRSTLPRSAYFSWHKLKLPNRPGFALLQGSPCRQESIRVWQPQRDEGTAKQGVWRACWAGWGSEFLGLVQSVQTQKHYLNVALIMRLSQGPCQK